MVLMVVAAVLWLAVVLVSLGMLGVRLFVAMEVAVVIDGCDAGVDDGWGWLRLRCGGNNYGGTSSLPRPFTSRVTRSILLGSPLPLPLPHSLHVSLKSARTFLHPWTLKPVRIR